MTDTAIRRKSVVAGGHRVAYGEAGPADGPVVVLLHGLASDSRTWDRAQVALGALGVRTLALDLIGHGRSDKPRSAYHLDDFALSVRDVLDVLAIDAATLCGHSLGGAIAMAFAARHRARIDHLVLVSAGGLGREVHPLLRAASLPGAPAVLGLAVHRQLRRLYRHPRVHRTLRLTADNLTNLRRAGHALGEAEGRAAFFAALRGVIQPGGQRGSFIDMGLLDRDLPTLLIWNERDPVIPVAHARATQQHLPGSRLTVFDAASHEPHRRDAVRFADEVAGFVRGNDL